MTPHAEAQRTQKKLRCLFLIINLHKKTTGRYTRNPRKIVTAQQRTRRADVERGATLHFSPDRDMREGSCRGEQAGIPV
ncbi:MAG: hypothetical protein WC076_12325, partial [Terrimicrobiaceae bacterium]